MNVLARRGARALAWGTGAAALVAGLGALRWQRIVAHAVARLDASGPDAPGLGVGRLDARLAALPPPVRRYLALVLPAGAHLPRRLRIEQAGWLRNDAADPWRRFQAVQHVLGEPPGFVWDASVDVAPLVKMRVLDAYVAGRGTSRASLLGLAPLGPPAEGAQADAASLMRWLAEAAWWPGALLPRPGLTWTAVDQRCARATLIDGRTSVSVDFHFGEDGLLERCSALRHRAVGGDMVPTPWGGRYRRWRRIGAVAVPTAAEVHWDLPPGRVPVWRGRITSWHPAD